MKNKDELIKNIIDDLPMSKIEELNELTQIDKSEELVRFKREKLFSNEFTKKSQQDIDITRKPY